MVIIRRFIAILIVLPLLLSGGQVSIQEQIVGIPIGSVVEVKTVGKEKLKGQLVSVSGTDITVRVAASSGTQERPIAFDQIKSVANKSNNGRTGLKILAGVGIALGALMLVGIIIAATVGD